LLFVLAFYLVAVTVALRSSFFLLPCLQRYRRRGAWRNTIWVHGGAPWIGGTGAPAANQAWANYPPASGSDKVSSFD